MMRLWNPFTASQRGNMRGAIRHPHGVSPDARASRASLFCPFGRYRLSCCGTVSIGPRFPYLGCCIVFVCDRARYHGPEKEEKNSTRNRNRETKKKNTNPKYSHMTTTTISFACVIRWCLRITRALIKFTQSTVQCRGSFLLQFIYLAFERLECCCYDSHRMRNAHILDIRLRHDLSAAALA